MTGWGSASIDLQIRKRIALHDRAAFALLLNQLRHQTGPTGLMTRSQARSGVAVEIFVKPIVVAIVPGAEGVAAGPLERPRAVSIPQPKPDETIRELVRDLVQSEKAAGTGRAFHLEFVAVIMVELLERLDQQIIDGQ